MSDLNMKENPYSVEPIKHFDSEKQLKDCTKYWAYKLFLTDWTIKVKLVKSTDCENQGHINIDWVNKSALIYITDITTIEDLESYTQTICEEKTLVHELLHLKEEYYQSLNENAYFSGIKKSLRVRTNGKELING